MPKTNNHKTVQDIAGLSEENVNVANWVNSTLQKTNGLPNKEVSITFSAPLNEVLYQA